MNTRNLKIKNIFLFLILFICVSICATAAENKYTVKNLRSSKNAADYIAIAPEEFYDALTPLLDQRAADGLRVILVSPSQIYDEFNRPPAGPLAIRAFVNFAWHNWQQLAPKFLLLTGDINIYEKFDPDAPVVPTFLVKVHVMEDAFTPSDAPFADIDSDNIPDIAYGRLPVDNAEELSVIVDKILNYENNSDPGPWRRRVSAFASTGDFGIFDTTLEELTKRVTRNNFDPAFDMNMTYAGSKLPYFALPDNFNPQVLNRFNEGSLFLTYIGHGYEGGLTHVCWKGQCRKIFEMEDIVNVNATGRNPFFFSICCLTGKFDLEKDSFAEELLKSAAGPIGVFAAGELSGPYPNAILSKDMLYFFVEKRPVTVGEGLLNLRKGLVRRMDDDRKFLDKQYTLISTKEDMEKSNYDHVFMYNFFGDPATKISYPAETLKISAPEKISSGDTFEISVKAPGGPAKLLVTLESNPTQVIHEIKPIDELTGKILEETVATNYENANNKVAVKIEANVAADGMATVKLTAPKSLPTETYYVKAYAWDGIPDTMGKREISITNPVPPVESSKEKEAPPAPKPIDIIAKIIKKNKEPDVKVAKNSATDLPQYANDDSTLIPGKTSLEENIAMNPASASARVSLAKIYFSENRFNEVVGLLKQASYMSPSTDDIIEIAALYRNLNLYDDAEKTLYTIPALKRLKKHSSKHNKKEETKSEGSEKFEHAEKISEKKKKDKNKKHSRIKDSEKKEEPAPERAYFLLANILQNSGNTDDLETLYLEIADKYKSKLTPHYELARIYAGRKNYDAVVEELDKLATMGNLPSYMKSYLYRFYNYLGNSEKAFGYAEKSAKSGEDTDAYWMLAKMEMDKESPDVEKAFNYAWSYFLANGQKDAKAMAVASFISLLGIQRSESSREYLDLALKISPSCVDCATYDWRSLRPTTSMDYCAIATTIGPGATEPLLCLGVSNSAEGNYEKAAGYFRQYRALSTRPPSYEEVEALDKSGAAGEAVSLIRNYGNFTGGQSGQNGSVPEQIFEEQLSLYFHIKQFDAALREYYLFIEKNPVSYFAHHLMAKTAADFEKYDLATTLEKKALSINPFCVSCYVSLGDYSDKAGQYMDARNAYSAALEMDRRDDNLKARLGRVMWKMGDEEKARKLLLEVISTNSRNNIAQETFIEMVNDDFFYR